LKTIGLLGGMSWESTQEYYRIINREVNRRLGGLHSAQIVIYSVDFNDVEILQHKGDWQQLTRLMIDGARRVQDGGADFLVIATNTMHKVADEVECNISIPLLHITDATAAVIKEDGFERVGLLGTRFTMEEDFYRGRLTEKHNIEVLIPDRADRDIVHRVIYDELCRGIIRDDSKREFHRIIMDLSDKGALGIILGCTEISLLVERRGTDIPLFDTTEIHAQKAVDWALEADNLLI